MVTASVHKSKPENLQIYRLKEILCVFLLG